MKKVFLILLVSSLCLTSSLSAMEKDDLDSSNNFTPPKLPDVPALEIIFHLVPSYKDVANLSATCRTWNELTNLESVWRRLAKVSGVGERDLERQPGASIKEQLKNFWLTPICEIQFPSYSNHTGINVKSLNCIYALHKILFEKGMYTYTSTSPSFGFGKREEVNEIFKSCSNLMAATIEKQDEDTLCLKFMGTSAKFTKGAPSSFPHKEKISTEDEEAKITKTEDMMKRLALLSKLEEGKSPPWSAHGTTALDKLGHILEDCLCPNNGGIFSTVLEKKALLNFCFDEYKKVKKERTNEFGEGYAADQFLMRYVLTTLTYHMSYEDIKFIREDPILPQNIQNFIDKKFPKES